MSMPAINLRFANAAKHMLNLPPRPSIPAHTWNKPFGEGWEKPYTVRYPSNLDDGPFHGMPVGGFGAGCIGRSHRGEYNLWHLDGGEHSFGYLPGCQFAVFENSASQPARVFATCSAPPPENCLQQWQWYPSQTADSKSTGTYRALYPRSWYVYENVFRATLTCEQLSPILPHNYQETSYPIAVYEWTAHNPTEELLELSIMMSWQNLVGWFTNTAATTEIQIRDDGSPIYDYQSRWQDSRDCFNEWVVDNYRVGCIFDRRRQGEFPTEGEGQMAIATVANVGLEVFYHSRWNPHGDGGDLWGSFGVDGSLVDVADATPAGEGEQIGGAIAVRFKLKPGQTKKIPFILAWDFPVTEFARGVNYLRRYTDFFGRSGNNVWSMVRTALKAYEDWQAAIVAWQQPILDRPDLPDWWKMAAFNELYLLTDGGTLWSAADERDPIGQFGVLECLDYRWYESLDVRLYGAFPLVLFWPKIELSVMTSFARAIPAEDAKKRLIGYYVQTAFGYEDRPQLEDKDAMSAPRKLAGATPHDLGAPNEHPWEKTNYTCYQDCNQWKDLGSDFVIQVYRAYLYSNPQDPEFLIECWPSIVLTIDYLKQFDRDDDNIPENSGAPDQTFDDWRLQGISTYCGGLWLTALQCAIAIADLLPPDTQPHPAAARDTYRQWLESAKTTYHERLWNGTFYRLDSDSGSEVIMADALCGQFLSRWLGLPDIVAETAITSHLQAVYSACYSKFHNGEFGAANGVKIDGSPAKATDTHQQEVWTGINFGVAAFLHQMNAIKEGDRLAKTVVERIYTNGLQFRSPEAITAAGTFRASHYLRAMAIWAIFAVK
jgi:non-lysosomal glucosylceramidase